MAIRTFLALDLNDSVLDALQAVRAAVPKGAGNIRWTRRENLHVTLHFLGDVEDDVIPDVCGATAEVARQVAPFHFDLGGVAARPSRGPLRMIWANVTDPTGELAVLHELLGEALAGIGMRTEMRQFRPHITLARIRGGRDSAVIRRAAESFAEEDFGRQLVGEVVVYSSQLTPEGPIYTSLCRAPLAE